MYSRILGKYVTIMSIYPTYEWKYFSRYRMSAIDTHTWRDKIILDYLPEVRNIIQENGPLTSSDINLNHQVDWSWGPTKASRAILDLMFFIGELIIFDKNKSRKIYDFSTNHIRKEYLNAPDPNLSEEDYFKWGIKRRIGALGLMWNIGGLIVIAGNNLFIPEDK